MKYRIIRTDKADEQLRGMIFYKIDEGEKTVTIYAVVNGRQEYMNLI